MSIRHYEKVDLLISPMKGGNGYRLYSLEDLRKIRFIRIAKSYGFSLKEIRMFFPYIYEAIHCEDKESMITILNNKKADIDKEINELLECRNLILKLSHSIETDDHILCESLSNSLPH